MFDSFKRKLSSLFSGVSDRPVDCSSKKPSKTEISNGHAHKDCHDPYDFDSDANSPAKKQKSNGWFTGDQKYGPLSALITKPTSRAAAFAHSTAMTSRNSKAPSTSIPSRISASLKKPFQPDIAETPRIEYDRRFMQNADAPGAPWFQRYNMPADNTFRAASTSYRATDRLREPENHTHHGKSSSSAVPLGDGPVARSENEPSVLQFRNYIAKNQATAQDSFMREQSSRKQFSAAHAGLFTSRPNPYPCPSTVPGAMHSSPLDSSYAKDLRRQIRQVAPQAARQTISQPNVPRRSTVEPEVITIEDSDEENDCQVIETVPDSYRGRSSKLNVRRVHQISPQRPLGNKANNSLSGATDGTAADLYAEAYRKNPFVSPFSPEVISWLYTALSTLQLPSFFQRKERISHELIKRGKEIDGSDTDFIPLNSDQLAEIDRAFAVGRPEDVLSDAFKITIRRKDLATLKGLNWLNDEVANFFLEMIVDRSVRYPKFPKVYTFNTFFYPQLMNKGYQSLKRWTRRVDIFMYDMILVPVHLSSHWCLAVINLKEKSMKYYDSLGHHNIQCFTLLKGYLEEESKDKKRTDFRLDWEYWHFSSAADEDGIPQQENMCDCGVFMLKFADFISRGKTITFTQTDMPYFRRRICHEILQKKLLGW